MALRFMATNPETRCMLVADNRVEPFITLAQEEYLDFKRTAAVAFASFSLNDENRPRLVRSGALHQVMRIMMMTSSHLANFWWSL
jgi:hypothetical protein